MTEPYKACCTCRCRLRSALGETIMCIGCQAKTPDERDAEVAARVRRVERATPRKAGRNRGAQ